MEPQTDLEHAVVRRLIHQVDQAVSVSEVDCDASFFRPTGYRFGEHVLDSLDLVEIIVALEIDVGVALAELDDFSQIDSISKIAVLIERLAEPSTLASFESEWAGPSRTRLG
jgi:acyl carrier protein